MNEKTDPYAHARSQFAAATENHELTILHDDGVYRHLRLAEPGTGIWSWNIITWPGRLATSGDVANGFQFAREADMFDFFRRQRGEEINPDYWAEKMPPVISSRSYSLDVFRRKVNEEVEEWCRKLTDSDADALRAQIKEEVTEPYFENVEYEEVARPVLESFAFTDSDGHEHAFADTAEWDLSAYDHHFIIGLLAIVRGIAMYDAAKAKAEEQAGAASPALDLTSAEVLHLANDLLEDTRAKVGPRLTGAQKIVDAAQALVRSIPAGADS